MMNLYDIAWPNYELNLSQYVASFREGNDFSDITLLSDDDQHFAAHKFVLSACSPFFKNILKKYPKQFPLLYLGCVDSRNLEKLLDFMYKGSVKVPHEDLESLLASAKILRIEGLSQFLPKALEDNCENLTVKNNTQEVNNELKAPKTFKFEEDKFMEEIVSNKSKSDIQAYDSLAIFDNKEEFALFESMKNQEVIKKDKKPRIKSEQERGYVARAYCYEKIKITHVDEIKTKTEELSEKVGSLWKCKMCGKTTPSSKRNKMSSHIEQHFDGVSYDCSQCGKSLKTRTSMRVHMYRDHKSVPDPNYLPRII